MTGLGREVNTADVFSSGNRSHTFDAMLASEKALAADLALMQNTEAAKPEPKLLARMRLPSKAVPSLKTSEAKLAWTDAAVQREHH